MTTNQGDMSKKVYYAQAVFGDEEKKAVADSLENGFLASGPKVAQFEQEVAKLFGKKYGIAVNSGSSANLLAVKALNMPIGGEVITPVCTFSTTVSEIINNNLIPVFVDSVIGRYTINEDLVEQAITNKTVAILIPQLVGGISNMPKLYDIAKKHHIWLIDDSCDTFAPHIGKHSVSRYAHVSTTSFYGSHIITAAGIGGMVLTNNEKYRDKIITLRDWGRVGNDKEEFSKRFDFTIDNIPYDAKFLYSEFGYNLKMNEVSAAFGLEQLKKLPKFLEIRANNFHTLRYFFYKYKQFFHLPYTYDDKVKTNWLAFPLTITHDAPFTRYEFLEHLEKNGIQTRVLFSGNITRHPVYRDNPNLWRAASTFENADFMMANSLLLGCHHGMDEQQVTYLCQTADAFLSKYV